MDSKLFKLLLIIEELEKHELDYLSVWIEYNLQKKEAPEAPSH